MINTEIDQITQVEEKIGNTELYDFSFLSPQPNVKIFGKLEWQQLGGSVKARPAFNIIKNAILNGDLHEGKALLDASSGNTAIAYAAITKELGLKATIVLPENATQERKDILTDLGAEIIYSSPFEGADGAQVLARSIYEKNPEIYFYADQYNNDNNWKAHYAHTAEEILAEVQPTHFAASLGTTGTFTGVGRRLKEALPAVKIIGLQPNMPMHGLEGWKHLETAKVPGIYDPELADQTEFIDTSDAYNTIRQVLSCCGLRISPSAAASLTGAVQIAEKINEGTIVTVLADNADKYGEVYKELEL